MDADDPRAMADREIARWNALTYEQKCAQMARASRQIAAAYAAQQAAAAASYAKHGRGSGYIKRTCQECGGDYYRTKGAANRRYSTCSSRCAHRAEAARRKAARRSTRTRVCEGCAKPFEARAGARTCSARCRKALSRAAASRDAAGANLPPGTLVNKLTKVATPGISAVTVNTSSRDDGVTLGGGVTGDTINGPQSGLAAKRDGKRILAPAQKRDARRRKPLKKPGKTGNRKLLKRRAGGSAGIRSRCCSAAGGASGWIGGTRKDRNRT